MAHTYNPSTKVILILKGKIEASLAYTRLYHKKSKRHLKKKKSDGLCCVCKNASHSCSHVTWRCQGSWEWMAVFCIRPWTAPGKLGHSFQSSVSHHTQLVWSLPSVCLSCSFAGCQCCSCTATEMTTTESCFDLEELLLHCSNGQGRILECCTFNLF